jgi:hypothetical protein
MTMRRFRYCELRAQLPVLARGPLTKRAERYLREHFPDAAKEATKKTKPGRRRDGVREYTVTMMGAAQGESMPHLRMSGAGWSGAVSPAGRACSFVSSRAASC